MIQSAVDKAVEHERGRISAAFKPLEDANRLQRLGALARYGFSREAYEELQRVAAVGTNESQRIAQGFLFSIDHDSNILDLFTNPGGPSPSNATQAMRVALSSPSPDERLAALALLNQQADRPEFLALLIRVMEKDDNLAVLVYAMQCFNGAAGPYGGGVQRLEYKKAIRWWNEDAKSPNPNKRKR